MIRFLANLRALYGSASARFFHTRSSPKLGPSAAPFTAQWRSPQHANRSEVEFLAQFG
jgi:hypothetical protein